MFSAFFYIVSTAWLLFHAWSLKKSDEKMEPIRFAYLLIMFLMGEQAIFAFLFHLIHVSTGLVSIGVTNLLLGAGLYFAKRKLGKQEYKKPQVAELVGLFLVFAVALLMVNKIWGFSLRHMAFGSEDGVKVHFMLAEFLAENGFYENIQYFEALNDSLWMNIFVKFHVYMAHDRAHMLTQIINLLLTGMGFYELVRMYQKGAFDVKKTRNILAAIVTVFYMLGYPLYASMFGFAYFVQIMNILVAILIVYNQMRDGETNKWFSYAMLNILLFGMFPCYSFFIPFLFPALFLAVWAEYKETTGNVFDFNLVKKEAQIFLLPCVFGLINSFSNMKELGDGGGITNEGGCYFDLYSNFLRLMPFVVIGLVVLWKKRKSDILMTTFVWTLLLLGGLFVLNHMHKISLYYISKVYNILWLCCFLLVFLAFMELLEKMPVLVVGLVLMFVFSIAGHSSGIPEKIAAENPPGYVTIYDNEHGIYPNIYWFNEAWVEILHNQTHIQ